MDNYKEVYPTKNWKLLHKYDTELPADSIEWCPHEPYQNYFVCANYFLEEGQNRIGRIILFSVAHGELQAKQTLDTAAILDQKWCHCRVNGEVLLGVATAVGNIDLYKFNEIENQLELYTSCNIGDDEECLALSLDWSTGKYASASPEIVCSDSKGRIHRISLKGSTLDLISCWKAHDFEAWISAYYYWDDNVVFTGGDDALLKKFDQRCGNEPVAKNRSHEAGVTCIHSNKSVEHVIATGSYDGKLRLWDVRNIKFPEKELALPGTLWRVKWDPFGQTNVLVASMLGGVHAVAAQSNQEPRIIDSFYEHDNISYGTDWCYNRTAGTVVASCSMYDKLLCVSSLEINDE